MWRGRLARTGKPILLALSLVAVFIALRNFPDRGASFGAWAKQQGLIRFMFVATASCAVGIPRQAVALAAGYADDVVFGSLLALCCETAACLVNVIWARLLARHWVQGKLNSSRFARSWLIRLDETLSSRPFIATLSLRLLPVGNNLLLNLAAGVSRVPITTFVVASALGYIPQTIIFALLGAGIGLDKPTQFAVALGVFAASVSLGALALRRQDTNRRSGLECSVPIGSSLQGENTGSMLPTRRLDKLG